MVTLDQLLFSRDNRALRQRQLREEYPGKVLLCLTVIMPGAVKRSELSLKIASAAVAAVREGFAPVKEELKDLETGFEGYFIIDGLSELEVKKAATGIEDTHPLGRLFDLDVIGESGPVSRLEIGAEPRKCLICDRPARECMRLRSHSQEELIDRIATIVNNYVFCEGRDCAVKER